MSTDGSILIPRGTDTSLCCNAHPIAVGGVGDETRPRVSVLQEDLDPRTIGDIYTQENADNVVISWEGLNYFNNHGGPLFAQISLFTNGRINLCWGTGTLPGGENFSAGLEDDTVSLAFPATGAPFGANGVSSTFPANQCRCFQQTTTGGYVDILECIVVLLG